MAQRRREVKMIGMARGQELPERNWNKLNISVMCKSVAIKIKNLAVFNEVLLWNKRV